YRRSEDRQHSGRAVLSRLWSQHTLKQPTYRSFQATTETSRESRLMQKPTCFCRARKADKYFPSPLSENSRRILERLFQNTAEPSGADTKGQSDFWTAYGFLSLLCF